VCLSVYESIFSPVYLLNEWPGIHNQSSPGPRGIDKVTDQRSWSASDDHRNRANVVACKPKLTQELVSSQDHEYDGSEVRVTETWFGEGRTARRRLLSRLIVLISV